MTNEKKYNVLIVDDEYQARKLLTAYVSKIPSLRLIDSTSNVIDAKAVMQEFQIDILLLDIQMPEISGVEFARSLSGKPEIIFTTAFSEYAIDGFEINIADYLLKPVVFNRFFKAISKALDRLMTSAVMKSLEENLEDKIVEDSKQKDDYIILRADYRIYKVFYCDLLYIEGQREYVTFHTKTRRITAYYSLKKLEEELPSDEFVRIHKSYIVSLKYIEIIESGFVIINQLHIPIGKNYRNALLTHF